MILEKQVYDEPERTLELLTLVEAPQLTINTPVLTAAEVLETPLPVLPEERPPKFFSKLLKLLHIEEKQQAALPQPTAEPKPQRRSKFLSLFLETPSPKRDSSPISVSGAIKLDAEDLDVIRVELPNKASGEELSFDRKYIFVNDKIIGRGASGVVKLGCFVSEHERQVAVKEFRRRRKSETRQQYLKKLTTEYLIASKLHHPNIIETIDIVHDGKRWYEIMEYCPGGDLFSAIQNNDLGVDEIDSAFYQIAQGVGYLHSLGVAHRDIKPENMLVDCKGFIKIGDFGVSDLFRQEATAMRLSHGICGSSPYIAPEEFVQGDYDARAVDVWALAILYFAMVFHTIPWQVARASDPAFRQYLADPRAFEPFKRLSFGARTLLKRMLEPDPTRRITIAEILEDEWVRAIRIVAVRRCKRKNKHEFVFNPD